MGAAKTSPGDKEARWRPKCYVQIGLIETDILCRKNYETLLLFSYFILLFNRYVKKMIALLNIVQK